MKMRKQFAVCTAAMMTVSLTAGTAAMASNDKAFSIDMSKGAESVWDSIAMTNDDTVNTGVNIRSAADEDGQVVACLYRGGAVEVLNKGEKWTEVKSGDVIGYVRNDYLMYGAEAKGLADYYGVEGVQASWDDVKVFEYADANAPILASVNDGQTFQVVSDEGHWIGVQVGADQLAYVSEEDVKRVMLVDEAVPLDGVSQAGSDAEDASYEEDYDTSYDDGSDAGDGTYEDGQDYTDGGDYTDDGSYSDEGSDTDDGSYTDDGSDTDGTDYTDDSYDDANDDGSYTEDGSDEVYTDDTTDAGTEDSYDDTEDVETVDDAEEYTDSDYANAEDYTDDTVYDDSADGTDSGYEDTQDAASDYTEETSSDDSGSSVSSGDLDLMAAIIYCEAGNQSYEGMVAVGAVVMNRVASSSFPNTISEVIYQSGQFTPASSGALASELANGVPSACYDAASAALAGENPVGSALYFNAGSGSGMQIGDHQFY
ncbi:MAG: cell wall hydrolase [Lachnospiraceae bacterium]|nr:cell wall hydrolase [Lachnospiraceae bacterium]